MFIFTEKYRLTYIIIFVPAAWLLDVWECLVWHSWSSWCSSLYILHHESLSDKSWQVRIISRMHLYVVCYGSLILTKYNIAQWESVLVVGSQQFSQIGNYFTIWKNLLLSISLSKHNQLKIHKKCHDIPKIT